MSIVERALQKAQQAAKAVPAAEPWPAETAAEQRRRRRRTLRRRRHDRGAATCARQRRLVAHVARPEADRAVRHGAPCGRRPLAVSGHGAPDRGRDPPHQVAAAECDRGPRRRDARAQQRDSRDQRRAGRGQDLHVAEPCAQHRARPRDARDPGGRRRRTPGPHADAGPRGPAGPQRRARGHEPGRQRGHLPDGRRGPVLRAGRQVARALAGVLRRQPHAAGHRGT